MQKASGQGVRYAEKRDLSGVCQVIETDAAHRTGLDALSILPNNHVEMEGACLGAESRNPDEARALVAECARTERLGSIEVGKILLTQEGTIRLLLDFTGSHVDLTDTVADWLERFGHDGPPRMDAVIVGGQGLRFSELFSILAGNRVYSVETAFRGAR